MHAFSRRDSDDGNLEQRGHNSITKTGERKKAYKVYLPHEAPKASHGDIP